MGQTVEDGEESAVVVETVEVLGRGVCLVRGRVGEEGGG